MNAFLNRIGMTIPIIQAPMAGVSTPELASSVSRAGGLGSLGVGNVDAGRARDMIRKVRTLTDRPFNVNLFCHHPPVADPQKESAWLRLLSSHFSKFGARPSESLREIYNSFVTDEAMLTMLLEERPSVVSFHFGLPPADRITALKSAGIILLATATNLSEGRRLCDAGIDAIVAQGYEAGGHRGVFDPSIDDECLPTLTLTRQLVDALPLPIIAAGGIMDGAGIAAAMAVGACAAQLGTAYLLCPESSVDAGFRAALLARPPRPTVITNAISGRPARSLANRFTAIGESVDRQSIPDYPRAYDAGKHLHSAAMQKGEFGYGAQWAGQGFSQSRAMPAAELTRQLDEELTNALADARRVATTSDPG